MGFWLTVFFLMFGVIFYVGWRGHQAFRGSFKPGFIILYWIVYLLFAFSFIIFEKIGLGQGILKTSTSWLGGYSLAFLFYAFFMVIFIDLIKLADKWWSFIPHRIKHAPAKTGAAVLLLLLGLMGYGTWNALHPVFRYYEINLEKNAGEMQELNAIMVSDLHLGAIVDSRRLVDLVDRINECNPDIIFLVGDVIDGNVTPFVEQDMAATLSRLRPRFGTYMVLGNHDGMRQNVVPYVQAAGIKVLIDQYQLINGSFYLVGRSNRGHGLGSSLDQAPLDSVLATLDKSRSIILLDHNPSNLDEAESNGIDLQLSGHTHQGQMFPGNIITSNMYDVDWGYWQKGNLQVVVSDGFGTWGPPIRIGNKPEIVKLKIKFNSKI